MSEALRRAVAEAEARLRSPDFRNRADMSALYAAQRELAAARRKLAAAEGEPWAEAIDLGVTWDTGAPLPHIVSDGSRTTLICRAATRDPNWDGTYVRIVSPSDTGQDVFLRIDFGGCHSIKFGGPNDEALFGHPLYLRGLEPHRANMVHNSPWLEEARKDYSVHAYAYHSDESYAAMNHYFLAFHDETFEALAKEMHVTKVEGVFSNLLVEAAQSLIQRG